ncbi:MAG TPA: MBOAT family O-acyltransferase [Blastocatellia bacterium]|nr:MBOAT family O-acyltransferase [Blastocatellia bacterium]
MIFLAYWFLVFGIVALASYALVSHPRVRIGVLLVSCVVFHAHFAGPAGVLPIIVLATLTYLAGRSRKPGLCLGVMIVCASALVFYKYTRFLCQSVVGAVSPILGTRLWTGVQPLLPGAPPLAVSFFVFEFVHYLYDVRKGGEPIRNPIRFGSFAIFWPSIVAGPVKRYQQFLPALDQGLASVTKNDVVQGLIRVAIGLVKKAIADNLTIWMNFRQPQFVDLPIRDRWWIFFALAFRILLDFSGYSDMAIGYARMMGIRLPENFNWPYASRSLVEFWHRWHISLSLWIRDYIYIPLGGSRRGTARKILNGLLAFGICGLWHGAAWNFLAWGLYHGAGLAVNSNYRRALGTFGQRLGAWLDENESVAWAITMAHVSVGWLLFFYPIPEAWHMLKLLVPKA